MYFRYTCALFLTFISTAYSQGPKFGNCPVLPADNIWNTPVDTLPVLGRSASYISRIGAGGALRAGFGPGYYQGGLFGMPFVQVRGTQPKYPATFRYASESDPGPYAVPLNAPIQGGPHSTGDRHVIAIDTDNCILYELFSAFPNTNSWTTGGGAIFNLKSHALRPDGWTSADAAGLPIFPGIIRYEEIVQGEIRHALRIPVAYTQKAYVWPARHYASGITDPSYPPMGTRLRLRANFDISSYTPVNQIILRALKKYGMIVADNGASWFMSGEPDNRWNTMELRQMMSVKGSDFEAVDVSSLMIDPNSGQARQPGAGVTVAPATATAVTQSNRQFTASQAVTWLVNGVQGGNSQVGYVSATGVYSAPGAVPNPATVLVQAKGSSGTGTASVTIRYPPPAISSVSPTSIRTGAFTLTVTGTNFRTGAIVKLNGVSLATTFNSNTRLTATGSVAAAVAGTPVTVTNSDAQASNAVNIAVTATVSAPAPNVPVPPVTGPITLVLTPGTTVSVTRNNTMQFTATVSNTANKTVVWRVNGVVGGNATLGTITTSGLYRAPAAIPGSVVVTATSAADPAKLGYSFVKVL